MENQRARARWSSSLCDQARAWSGRRSWGSVRRVLIGRHLGMLPDPAWVIPPWLEPFPEIRPLSAENRVLFRRSAPERAWRKMKRYGISTGTS